MNVDSRNLVIEADGLAKSFGEFRAVDGLHLEIQRGEVFGFLGHNGAGKTTTVRLLNGALEQTSGAVRVLGMDPQVDGPALRRRTGVLTENPSLEERLTGFENLRIFADLYGVPARTAEERVHELLHRFDLLEAGGQYVNTYSKGMKQRLALARALIHDPELLFLDEPTSGLDPVAARNVHELIEHMTASREHTVFLCTHNLTEAQLLCDRVAVLEHGRVLALGSPAELTHKYSAGAQLEMEISKESIGKAIEILEEIPQIHINQTADILLQITGAARTDIPGLIKILTRADVNLYRVQPVEPTLQDVYFALHRNNNMERPQ